MSLPHSAAEGKIGKALEDTSMGASHMGLTNWPSYCRDTESTMLT